MVDSHKTERQQCQQPHSLGRSRGRGGGVVQTLSAPRSTAFWQSVSLASLGGPALMGGLGLEKPAACSRMMFVPFRR